MSTLFFALTIFPLYGIFRTCFSPLTVRIALLMAAFASIPLRYGASGLRDSGKGFFYILCVYLLVEVYRKRTDLKNYVFLGIAASLLALTRTEAPVYAGMFGLSVLGLELWRKKIVFPWRSCLCGLTALLLLSPWLAFMYRTTGYPVPDIRISIIFSENLETGGEARLDSAAAGAGCPGGKKGAAREAGTGEGGEFPASSAGTGEEIPAASLGKIRRGGKSPLPEDRSASKPEQSRGV